MMRPHPKWMSPAGFTLLELLVVVTILAALAGGVALTLSGTEDQANSRIIQAELHEIRKAFLGFKHDLGFPPMYLAELLQSPNPADPLGGWGWRPSPIPSRLFQFDPASERGWNGPYLRPEFQSSVDETTLARETRIAPGGAFESIQSSEKQRLALILSRFQQTHLPVVTSDYQLDFSQPQEITLRFLGRSAIPAQPPQTLGLGVRFP